MSSGPPNSVFSKVCYHKIQDDLTRRCIEKDNYIKKLEVLLREHGIELPASEMVVNLAFYETVDNMMKQGSLEELEWIVENNKKLIRNLDIAVEFHNLSYSTEVPKNSVIPTVGSVLFSMLTACIPKQTETIHILAESTGRILPRKMTLLLGPPGSGKSGMICCYSLIVLQFFE